MVLRYDFGGKYMKMSWLINCQICVGIGSDLIGFLVEAEPYCIDVKDGLPHPRPE